MVDKNVLKQSLSLVEKQVDGELERLENLAIDDLQVIRETRLKEMRELNQKKQQWLQNGHGTYTQLQGEKELFEATKKSQNVVCHFYHNDFKRCDIVDMHLKLLAPKHVEARFVKVDAAKSPFLAVRLRINMIPTIALIKDNKTKDFIVGFTDLGNCDNFSTEMLEWRIAQSGAIDFKGDLLTPPENKKNIFFHRVQKTIRGGHESDDSDIEFDDDQQEKEQEEKQEEKEEEKEKKEQEKEQEKEEDEELEEDEEEE